MYSFNQRYRSPQWFGIPAFVFFGFLSLLFMIVFLVYVIVLAGWLGLLSLVFLYLPIALIRFGYEKDRQFFLLSAIRQGRSDAKTNTMGFGE